MFFKKTVWIIIFIVFHTVLFKQSAHSDNQNYPTYSKFLKKFPDGYPKFSGPGNSKSMGAFKLYLEDLGFKSYRDIFGDYIVKDDLEKTNDNIIDILKNLHNYLNEDYIKKCAVHNWHRLEQMSVEQRLQQVEAKLWN